VSHELRTPLNAIIGFSDIVMKRSGDRLDARERDYLARVRASGTSLLSIIDAILTHARAESGSLTLERQRVDVAALVHEVARLAEGLRHAPDVTRRLSVAEGLPSVNVDPLRLTQVVTNLVSNALKFTPRGEVLLSVTRAPDGSQRIAVRDNGIGIPADRLEAIWTPFEQAAAGTARRYGGTGLGLPIARSLALLMGLQLEVVSERGEGSTFSVTIPAEWVLPAK
jgi:signal transduction histidine kinase